MWPTQAMGAASDGNICRFSNKSRDMEPISGVFQVFPGGMKSARNGWNDYLNGDTVVNRLNNALDFQQRALGLRAYRQQILASNIANADTPNYKARDFDFSAALKEAVAGRQSGAGLLVDRTHPAHVSGNSEAGPVRLMYRVPAQDSADGNTVEMDIERTQFSENAVQYQAGLAFITHQLKTMLTAIQAQS